MAWLRHHEALPTNGFHFLRQLAASDFCPRCEDKPKIVFHCLVVLKKCEKFVKFEPYYLAQIGVLHFSNWFPDIMKGEEMINLVGCWWIWLRRNQELFDPSKAWTNAKTVINARRTAFEMHNLNNPQSVSLLQSSPTNWNPHSSRGS
ncbi:RNA-directed DNA polymerase [Arachis hypogaea]|nr:RNA-directed DNA polymerase [Arachis hypogaea]